MSQRITFVEIELPVCEHVYGTAPCTAALGDTGEKKCFNTRATCQDTDNYSEVFETLRLAKPSAFLPLGITAVANIKSVDYTPSRLALGESIGVRSKLTITCGDHPFPDTGPGGDPYRESRSYDPYHQGTFWGKLKARQPYLRGKTLRWYTGDASQNLDQMERRTFVIDRVEGPSTNGQFTVIAKDPLTLTDDKRAQAPVLSRGVLSAAIDATQTSFTLSPAGIGDDEYPASGKVAIAGNEICTFTRSGDTMTVTRGVNNTEADSHDEDDRVQLVLEYDGEDPGDIIADLLTNYANTSADYINIENWNAETSEYLGRVYTGIIAEPVAVNKLVNEILQQAALTIWWDEESDQIRLQVLRDITQGTFTYSDDFILGGTFGQKDQPEKRVSQVWTYYGQINPLESQDDPKNYRNTLRTVNLTSETNHGSPAIKTIYSRWITQFGRTAVERLNNLIIGRYAEPPKLYTMELLRDSGTPLPSLGSGARMESFFNQDDEGLPVTSPVQIIQAKASDATVKYQAEEVIIAEDVEPDDPTTKVVPIDSDTTDFNFRTAYLQLYAEANSGDTVICEVRGGVVVGGTSTSSPAWRTGTGWPSGVTFELHIFDGAYVVGRGGAGGDGAEIAENGSSPGSPGLDGGPALIVDGISLTVDNQGVIGGGGGGGGGGGSATGVNLSTGSGGYSTGGGGGSGAGYVPATGGSTSTGDKTNATGNPTGETGGTGTVVYGGSRGDGGAVNGDNAYAYAGDGGTGGHIGQSGGVGRTGSAHGSVTEVSGAGSGGSAGTAVDGDSLITWTNEGSIVGARIN